MKIGSVVRNMGEQATRACVLECAKHAETMSLDHIWTVDHIAIPPDDAEGSLGRYLDPLATLAFLAAATEKISLGVAVLVLPYRAALPTAKWISTIQELSDHRLILGAGCGWMAPEFKALGIPRERRGAITDETLEQFQNYFGAQDDVAEANGQPFLFRPRPPPPPIYVGGMHDAALRRAARFGDGWIPLGLDLNKLQGKIEKLTEFSRENKRQTPEVIVMGGLSDSDSELADTLARARQLGVTQFIHSDRYEDERAFGHICERLANIRERLAT